MVQQQSRTPTQLENSAAVFAVVNRIKKLAIFNQNKMSRKTKNVVEKPKQSISSEKSTVSEKPTAAVAVVENNNNNSNNTNETPTAKPVEEANTQNSFLIEKHRYTKGRLITRVDKEPIDAPLCLRFGSHFIKTTFLLDQCNSCNHACTEQVNLMLEYNKICKLYENVNWEINKAAMEACLMNKNEIAVASAKKSKKQFTLPEVDNAGSKLHSVKPIFDARVILRKKRRVLVPFSGGISSMATLWWCLLKDYDVYLCYAFGALENTGKIVEKQTEIECVLRLLQYVRRLDGKLLFDKSDDPESGVYQLSREEIAERIRIVQIPLASYHFPNGENMKNWPPFSLDYDGQSLKAHPQSYLLFYRQMVIVAQSLNCSAIALGMHGNAKQLLSSAQPFFTKIHTHDLFIPFENRTEALVSFQEAAQQSWQVWKSYFQRNEQELPAGHVWQTAGPALMPNAAHYVSTCSKSTRVAREQVLLQAQNAALERVQSLLVDELEKEAIKMDEAAARGEKIRKKRAPDPFQHAQFLTFFIEENAKLQCDNSKLFHFCGDCIDCWQWRKISNEWSKLKENTIAPQWQNIATEYIARINATVKKQRVAEENIVVTDQELSVADLRHQDNNDDEEEEEAEEEEEDEIAFEEEQNVVEEDVVEELEDDVENEQEENQDDTAENNEEMEEDEDDEDDEEDEEEEEDDDMMEDDANDDADDGSEY